MPRFFSARFVFAFLAFGLIASTTPTPAQLTATSPSGPIDSASYRAALEQQTFAMINQYRLSHQFPVFKWDDAIGKVARAHSQEMASGDVDFGHDGFSKRVSTLKKEMVGLKGAGENVLKTNNPDEVAQAAVNSWLHSPHHLANIRGDFNCSGMGIWVDDQGMIYFTQIFVKIVPPEPAAQAQAQAEPGISTPFGFLATPSTRPTR